MEDPNDMILGEYGKLLNSNLPQARIQILELAYATLIRRACSVGQCSQLYPEKYAKVFRRKYEGTSLKSFCLAHINEFVLSGGGLKEKLLAVAQLRNLGASAELVGVAKDEGADVFVRLSAISGLTGKLDPIIPETLLSIYYNRSAQLILRTKAADMLLINHYEELMVEQMILSMWAEQEATSLISFLFSFFKNYDGSAALPDQEKR
jgi:hypothetical protein